MKNLITALLLLSNGLNASDCVDLSHKQVINGITTQIKQVGCEKFEIRRFVQDRPVGNELFINIFPEWTSSQMDGDRQRIENRQLWTWNRNRTAIIHEFAIYSYDKESRETRFDSGSDLYTLANKGVHKRFISLIRIERADGTVEQTATPVTDIVFPKLF